MKKLWGDSAKALLLASILPLTAQAAMLEMPELQPYIGGQLSSQHLKYDDSSESDAVNFGTASLQAGVNINPFLAVEGRLGKSFNNNQDNGYRMKLKDYYGIYLKLGLPTGTMFTPYGLFGKTWGKIKVKQDGESSDLSGNDFSWGIGLQAAVSKHVAIALEYTDMYDKHNYELKNVGVLVNYVF
ncbi:porin family protein [Celerinatantimonas diazotrophica]|uniref:Opacity protein-like surface antigen n=1 Tax=Celerinatantimonas diazotrophica TaxID=412034 RepID=A0A4R1J8F5_9GAMM|nr:porin family protein [Celerinatantimonas diazotrophica]TCK46816.1 opacity protein-like surface antigen [Celerinatantimonas diazotrophica]CAG9295519.1 hypothetical protein CEDIAZO_00635 [Celerinatantimonas diazotrophica]